LTSIKKIKTQLRITLLRFGTVDKNYIEYSRYVMSKRRNYKLIFIGTFIILLCIYASCLRKESFKTTKCNLFNNPVPPKKVHVWHSTNNNATFMYKPITDSVLKILKYLHPDVYVDYKTFSPEYEDPEIYNQIQANDVLIWLGIEKIIDFKKFKEKGVYTVYYNTEPADECDYCNSKHTGEAKYYSNEIWTYSKFLLETYTKDEPSQIIKFVPVIYQENVPRITYSSKGEKEKAPIKLVFIGNLDLRPQKKDKLLSKEILKNNLIGINHIWSDEAYNNFILENPHLHLNLTKGNTKTLPSVRINKLLSHGAIVISEHTNPIDEELYGDMVNFCNLDDIESVYKKLSSMTREEIQRKSDKIHNDFYEKFNVTKICNYIQQK